MPNDEKTPKKPKIELFSTKNGINIIKSPMKAQIISLLKKGEMSFDKIVANTGKSKSTISEHLQGLVDQDIIAPKPDPQDARKKNFYIKSRYLGGVSSENNLNIKNLELTSFISDYKNPFEFYRLLFRTIRVALLKEGINIDPILHDTGLNIGKTLYNDLKAPKFDKFLQNVTEFWQMNKLGRIEIKKQNSLIINAYDCFECEDLPKLGRSACALDSGLLEALFSLYFGHEIEVDEVKCYAKGDGCCSFIMKDN